MPTFKHSGDLGDIVYSLPALRALGGGVLYLDVTGGRTDPEVQRATIHGHTKFAHAGYDTLRPLLLEQPYITDVQPWTGQPVDHNLDRFRQHVMTDARLNLVTAHLRAFRLPEVLTNQPWLTIRKPPVKLHKPLIINRTVRYHSKYHWWLFNAHKIVGNAVFLGYPKEHDIFQYTFDVQVDYHRAADALEIAQILLGSECLIGNQSFIMAIAHGLGTAYLEEAYDYAPSSIFSRENGKYL